MHGLVLANLVLELSNFVAEILAKIDAVATLESRNQRSHAGIFFLVADSALPSVIPEIFSANAQQHTRARIQWTLTEVVFQIGVFEVELRSGLPDELYTVPTIDTVGTPHKFAPPKIVPIFDDTSYIRCVHQTIASVQRVGSKSQNDVALGCRGTNQRFAKRKR